MIGGMPWSSDMRRPPGRKLFFRPRLTASSALHASPITTWVGGSASDVSTALYWRFQNVNRSLILRRLLIISSAHNKYIFLIQLIIVFACSITTVSVNNTQIIITLLLNWPIFKLVLQHLFFNWSKQIHTRGSFSFFRPKRL